MLLDAQATATHTSFGAVEVAAAFFRWTYQFPHPTSAEIQAAREVFAPSGAAAAERNLKAEYERNPNPSNGAVPRDNVFHLTTVGARWLVQDGAIEGQQRVSILAPFVINDSVSPTKTASEAFDMQLISGRWRVISLAESNPSQLAAGGTAFTAGC